MNGSHPAARACLVTAFVPRRTIGHSPRTSSLRIRFNWLNPLVRGVRFWQ
jgi:hypothetical protein